jgi:hypothetical protein
VSPEARSERTLASAEGDVAIAWAKNPYRFSNQRPLIQSPTARIKKGGFH